MTSVSVSGGNISVGCGSASNGGKPLMAAGSITTSASPISGLIEMQVCIKNDGSITTGTCQKNKGISMILFGRKA